jgi:hypothetical protein
MQHCKKKLKFSRVRVRSTINESPMTAAADLAEGHELGKRVGIQLVITAARSDPQLMIPRDPHHSREPGSEQLESGGDSSSSVTNVP